MMTHEEWWREVGSGIPPMPGEDAYEHVRRVTAACWPAARAAIYEAEAYQLTAPVRIDAARYRFLRSGRLSFDMARSILNDVPHGIDSAVDAAMLKTPNAELRGRPLADGPA